MQQENPQIGYLYAVAAALSYGAMSFYVHANPYFYSAEQLVFYRGTLSALCLLPFCYRDLGRYFEKKGHMLWVRSLSGASAVICYFYALQGTASANANLLFSCSPVFVCLLSWIFFREKITKPEALGIAFIILGNIFLYIPQHNPIPLWVGAVGTIGAFLASIAYLSLGKATKTYSSALIVFGFSLTSVILALLYPGSAWTPVHSIGLPYILFVSLLGLLSQFLSTKSFTYLKSPVAAAIGRSSIIFSAFLDISIAHYSPAVLEILSYFTVIVGIYIVHRYRAKKTSQMSV